MDKLKMHSLDKVDENVEKIGTLFPNCVTEAKVDGKVTKVVDFDKLKQELSDFVVEGRDERYQFTWPDKKQSILLANAPISETLRPSREESVNFDETQNLYIEGDNLDVLKLLQETYLNKVKMIYIDPPYNTGNDFVYEDDFAQTTGEYLENSGQFDEAGNRMVKNLDSNGRFHTDWLNMIYPRLRIAKDLLSVEGAILISIDDNELENLKKICDEVFGETNYIGMFIINSSPSAIDYGHMGKMNDYTLFYAKNIDKLNTNLLPDNNKIFKYKDDIGAFNLYPLYNGNVAFNPKTRPNLYYPFYLNPHKKIDEFFFEIGLEKKDNWIEVYPVISKKDNIPRVWRWGRKKASEGLNKEIIGYKTDSGEYRIVQKTRLTGKMIRSLQLDTEISSRRGTREVEDLFNRKVFSFPKPPELIRRYLIVTTNQNDIILDFFSGSATTAHAVMQLNAEDGGNRQFIMVQLPEETDEKSEAYKAGYKNICEIGKERIRRAGAKIKEENKDKEGIEKLDTGFRVLKLDSTNMKDVYYTPEDTNISMFEELTDNIKDDRSPEDLLFQVMLDLGILLSSKIEEMNIKGKTIFNVADGFLVACFDKDLTDDTITEIAKMKPYYFVMRDHSLATDAVAANFDQIFTSFSPDTVRKVL
jgi:adenine-specific DNA-methyltransferase